MDNQALKMGTARVWTTQAGGEYFPFCFILSLLTLTDENVFLATQPEAWIPRGDPDLFLQKVSGIKHTIHDSATTKTEMSIQ